MYQPEAFTYYQQNILQAHGQPNNLYMNSAIYDYWWRNLYQRLTSIFEWTLPEGWEGSNKDFMNWLLFNVGYCGVINSAKYGHIFQPVSWGEKRNIFYQPNSFIVCNPYDSELDGEYECGNSEITDEKIKDHGEFLKLTPDFMPATSIVSTFASRLALLYTAVNTSLLNCRNPKIYAAKSKTAAQALKIMQDKVYSGDPFVILSDKALYPDPKTAGKDEPLFTIDGTSASQDYITSMLLEDEQTILKEFDNSIGISNLDNKKERLVTSEAEVQKMNSSASAFVWYDCLKDSISKIKDIFPDITLDVRLRFGSEGITEQTGGVEDVPGDSDLERN